MSLGKEEFFMSDHYSLIVPAPIANGFHRLYDEGVNDEKYEAFASRWGGLDLETFEHVLRVGDGEDRILAIFVVGATDHVLAAESLLPFLSSPKRMERWASALALGMRKDERACPAMQALLLDGLSLEERSMADLDDESDLAGEIYECALYRRRLVSLLAYCKEPSLVQTLSHTFKALWHIEQTLHLYANEEWMYDVLAYELGRRGAFDALNGLDLPAPHRKTALVYVALGSLHVQPSPVQGSLVGGMYLNKELRPHIAQVLAQHFGLSPAEQKDCIENFYAYAQERKQYRRTHEEQQEEEEEEYEADEGDEGDEEEEEGEYLTPTVLCQYRGHQACVNSLCWSPDGQSLVSASTDTTAQIWDATTGERRLTFRGHTASVNAVAWSPQGRLIASGGNDNVVLVWDAITGEQVCTYRGHRAWISWGLAWSPDGTRIASCSLDRTVQVWDAFSGETLVTYRGHTAIVSTLTWSPDGAWIASGAGYPDGSIAAWDAATGEVNYLYNEHRRDDKKERPLFGIYRDEWSEHWARETSSVHGLAWSPDGQYLASAGLRFVCRVWEALTGKTIVASDRTCGPLAWSPDSTQLLSLNMSSLDLWDACTNTLLVNYQRPDLHDITAFGWSPDGTRIAVASQNATVQVWRGRELGR